MVPSKKTVSSLRFATAVQNRGLLAQLACAKKIVRDCAGGVAATVLSQKFSLFEPDEVAKAGGEGLGGHVDDRSELRELA
jgi:hypothetical protein